MWYRVFAGSEADVQPGDLLEHLHAKGLEVKGHFRGDDEGWFEAQLVVDDRSQKLSRFLVSEEGVRAELNTWAAWVELQTDYAGREELMQQIISTKQMFVMEVADDEKSDSPLPGLCQEICRYLAIGLKGIYQVDEAGFLEADGGVILAEIGEDAQARPLGPE